MALKLTSLFFLFILLTGKPSGAQDSLSNIQFAVKDIEADARYLTSLLNDLHPGVNWYNNEISLPFGDLAKGDSVNLRTAMSVFHRMVVDVRCGHTNVLYPPSISKLFTKDVRRYPKYRFHRDGDLLRVGLAHDGEQCIPLGSELVSINGHKADSLHSLFFRLSTTDGYNHSRKELRAEESFSGYYRYYIEDADTHSYVCKFQDSLFSIKEAGLALSQVERSKLLEADRLFWAQQAEQKDKGHKLFFLDDRKDLAVLEVSSFTSSGPSFYRKAFEEISDRNIEHLILDLRYCPGGKVADAFVLLSYLLDHKIEMKFIANRIKDHPEFEDHPGLFGYKITNFVLGLMGSKNIDSKHREYGLKLGPRKKNYRKNIYVLINEQSFSASCIVASQLKGQKNTLILGRESGGGFRQTSAMIVPTFELPNTGFRARIPLYQIIHDVSGGLYGHGVFPDVLLERSFEDKVEKRDLAFDYILKSID